MSVVNKIAICKDDYERILRRNLKVSKMMRRSFDGYNGSVCIAYTRKAGDKPEGLWETDEEGNGFGWVWDGWRLKSSLWESFKRLIKA